MGGQRPVPLRRYEPVLLSFETEELPFKGPMTGVPGKNF